MRTTEARRKVKEVRRTRMVGHTTRMADRTADRRMAEGLRTTALAALHRKKAPRNHYWD